MSNCRYCGKYAPQRMDGIPFAFCGYAGCMAAFLRDIAQAEKAAKKAKRKQPTPTKRSDAEESNA